LAQIDNLQSRINLIAGMAVIISIGCTGFWRQALNALRVGRLGGLIPGKMSLEYPAFESGQGCFNRLDKDADASGSEAAGARPGANRVA